ATDARHFLVNSRDGLFAKVTNVIDDPETGMHDDGRFGIYEIAMSPDALQVVQSDAAQAVAIGHGFTGLSLAEPLVVSRDNAAGTETIVYPEFEGTTILPPDYDDLYAAMLRDPYVQNLISAANALKEVFREAGIDAGDLDFTQLMVCPSPDGSKHL